MQNSTEAAPPRRIIRGSGTFIVAAAALVIASLPVAFELGKRSKEPVTEIPLTLNVSGRFLIEDLEGETFLLTDQDRNCAYLVSGPTIRALDEGSCEPRPSDLPTKTPP